MSAPELESNVYQQILDFALLDPFEEDYHKKVLSLMKTHFDGNLAAYTAWSLNNTISSCFSFGLPDDFIHTIHTYYVRDRIRQLVIERLASNSWNGIFYSQDVDLSEAIESKALEYLHENHIHYFAIMLLSTDPREHYILCKTEKEGSFSDREKAILRYIYQIVSHHMPARHAYQKAHRALSMIDRHFDQDETGYILVDDRKNVLSFNHMVFSLIPKKLNLTRADEIAEYVFSLFEDTDQHDRDQEEKQRMVSCSGRSYLLEEMTFLNIEKQPTRFFFIKITRNKKAENKLSLQISAQYGLTEREIQISELIVGGYSNQDIAESLHISISTVKIHVANLFRKLQVHTRMEAIMKLTKSF